MLDSVQIVSSPGGHMRTVESFRLTYPPSGATVAPFGPRVSTVDGEWRSRGRDGSLIGPLGARLALLVERVENSVSPVGADSAL